MRIARKAPHWGKAVQARKFDPVQMMAPLAMRAGTSARPGHDDGGSHPRAENRRTATEALGYRIDVPRAPSRRGETEQGCRLGKILASPGSAENVTNSIRGPWVPKAGRLR